MNQDTVTQIYILQILLGTISSQILLGTISSQQLLKDKGLVKQSVGHTNSIHQLYSVVGFCICYFSFGIPRVRVRKLYDIDLSKISFDSGIECQHTVYTSQGSLQFPELEDEKALNNRI